MDSSPEAFGELVNHYKERVYMVALQMTHNHADADELSQQAFLRAYESIDRFRGDADFFTWIYRITVNLCLTHLKNRNRWSTLPQEHDEDGANAPEFGTHEIAGASIEEDQDRRLLWEALDQLSPELRASVVLVYLQDLSPREAAKSLGCAEATMHWRLFKARKLLKQYLSRPPLQHGGRPPRFSGGRERVG